MGAHSQDPSSSYQTLLLTVAEAITDHGLLQEGDGVLVAVSGGADSMLLLHVLQHWAASRSCRVCVAHLNHNLRGEESALDAELVRAVCARHGVELVEETLPEGALCGKAGLSLEMAARGVRHAFLAEKASHLGLRRVATAHHADDQLELFLLRLLRGSTIHGLAGMTWCSPSPANPSIQIIRPFLDLRRSEILAAAKAAAVPYREDSSNASVDHQRNWLRHRLIPMLEGDYQPALQEVLKRTAESFREDSDFLEAFTRQVRSERQAYFPDLHPALQRRVVRDELIGLGITPDWTLIRRLLGGGKVSVAGVSGMRCLTLDDSGDIRIVAEPEGFCPDLVEFHLGEAGATTFGGADLSWSILQVLSGEELPAKADGDEVFDADKVGGTIILRHWQPGDRFKPIGMSQSVKLQDLFTNLHIDRDLRKRLIVAATVQGDIFWVEGVRISEEFKVTSATIRRLHWRWRMH
jgi:tRNA(Ile)-lysidine synthase